MSQLILKQSIVVVIVIAALLVALVAGVMRAQRSLPGQHSGMHSAQQLAWYCPAPPVDC